MFSGFSDQANADGEDGEGECGTGSGRSQHHRPAGKHAHPRSVWPTGENLGPRSAAETGQTHNFTCLVSSDDLKTPSGTVCPRVNSHQAHEHKDMTVWTGWVLTSVFILNRGSLLFGPICFTTRRPRGRRRHQLSLQVRAQHGLFVLCKSRVEWSLLFNLMSVQGLMVRTRERLMMALRSREDR